MKKTQTVHSNSSSLFDEYGSYNFTSFLGKENIIWRLQSTETNSKETPVPKNVSISKTLWNCLDTFTDGKGNYITKKRFEIMDFEKKGNIKPLLESRIYIPTMDSKEWNKRKVRNI